MAFDVVTISADLPVSDTALQMVEDRRALICLARIDECLTRAVHEDSLSELERCRAAAFRFEKDRFRFIVRRGLLRQMLSLITGMAVAELRIAVGQFGKPMLADLPGLHFSVSHSDGLVCLGFSREGRIGVDVERRSELSNPATMARTIFSAADTAEIESLRGDAQRMAFFRTWTRLEALTKAIGTGLSDCPDVALSSAGKNLSVAVDNTEWRITDVPVGVGFAGAVALEVDNRVGLVLTDDLTA